MESRKLVCPESNLNQAEQRPLPQYPRQRDSFALPLSCGRFLWVPRLRAENEVPLPSQPLCISLQFGQRPKSHTVTQGP